MDKLSGEHRSGCGSPPCPMVHPWLVFPYGKNGKFQVFVDPLDPSKTYRKRIPEMRYHSYCESSSREGWFIMLADEENDSRSKYSDCFLWNPETSEKIQLPTPFHWMNKHVSYGDVIYSPPSNNNICDSTVYLLFLYGDHKESLSSYFLLYCHPGDEQWRQQNLPRSIKRGDIAGLICLKSNLYLISFGGELLEIEKETQQESSYYEKYDVDDDEYVLKVTPFCMENIKLSVGEISSPFRFSKTYVTESRGEVFKVVRHYYDTCTYFRKTDTIDLEVFSLDFSLMVWTELKSLGDHVLFLDRQGTTARSCSAKELGLTRGYIFFVLENDKTLYKFDIEDGSIEFSLPCPNLPTPWLSPSWMTTLRALDGKRKQRMVVGNDAGEDIVIKAKEEIKDSINLEEESRLTTWGSLCRDTLELISSYLHSLDYLHFRAVCRENRLATTTKMKYMQYASSSPWLVFLKTKGGAYNLAEPIYNDKFFINPSDISDDAILRFSKGGWLLMTKGHSRTIFFYNPFTRAVIHLPDLPDEFPSYNYPGMAFSSLPTSSDCVVMGIAESVSFNYKQVWLFYITRGVDSWSFRYMENTCTLSLPSEEVKCVEFIPWRNNPVFYKDVFYCLDFKGKLGVLDTRDFTWKILDLHGPCNSVNQSFLVECDGKLLAVFLSDSRTCIKVFRLDTDKKLWVKVESLGKYMLFISNASSLSAVAPNSQMENKIYFPRFHGEDIIYYSLDTCKYHTFGSRQYSGTDFYNTKEQLHCTWIEPNWSQTAAQELVTKDVEE